jgi:toxin HigB-1
VILVRALTVALADEEINRLEALKGDRAGQFSIRINSQWRICFEGPVGAPGPSHVEIVDDH